MLHSITGRAIEAASNHGRKTRRAGGEKGIRASLMARTDHRWAPARRSSCQNPVDR